MGYEHSPERVMARAGQRERIAVRTTTWEGSIVLEWRPRLIALMLVVVLIALIAGISSWDYVQPMNWEW